MSEYARFSVDYVPMGCTDCDVFLEGEGTLAELIAVADAHNAAAHPGAGSPPRRPPVNAKAAPRRPRRRR